MSPERNFFLLINATGFWDVSFYKKKSVLFRHFQTQNALLLSTEMTFHFELAVKVILERKH